VRKLALAVGGLLAVAVLASTGGFLWWRAELDAFAMTPFGSAGEKIVEIPAGAGMKQVAERLKQAGVVSDPARFYWLSRLLKKDRSVKAGEYGFEGDLLPEKVLDQIVSGHVRLHRCTIAEGLRLDEIAPLLEQCQFASAKDVLRLSGDAAFVKKAGVTGTSLEGYLFPDTYAFPKNPRPDQVLLKMVGRFHEEYEKANARRKSGVTLDVHEAATLASIIEKETGVPEERPRISCVFHNRLRKNMKLETDPTVIYAKILRVGAFDGNIHREDLLHPHPYNTYTVKGLPPGPIASAGTAALVASLDPAECEDLFFVACGGGTHRFCPDYECHEQFVDKCQRRKRGP
jgi:UPF0755 protein